MQRYIHRAKGSWIKRFWNLTLQNLNLPTILTLNYASFKESLLSKQGEQTAGMDVNL